MLLKMVLKMAGCADGQYSTKTNVTGGAVEKTFTLRALIGAQAWKNRSACSRLDGCGWVYWQQHGKRTTVTLAAFYQQLPAHQFTKAFAER
jgi:hypothetical protein